MKWSPSQDVLLSSMKRLSTRRAIWRWKMRFIMPHWKAGQGWVGERKARDEEKKKNLSKVFERFLVCGEDDGNRTRNLRIDSPVL